MPAPGDQHQPVTNPFQPQPQQQQQHQQHSAQFTDQRISLYTAQEIATLQSRLEKQLGPEYLSARAGPSGQKVHYIAAEKVISLANEVFGFNGWSSSIQTIQIDFVDEHPHTLKISVGLSVIVRVTLRDGTYHEDIGYGHIENCKGKAAAFEKAKKEGTTDALKRTLRNFGNVLGNCIYDKAYVDRVSKMKVVPNHGKRSLDERGLHRHADYVVKTEVDAPPAPAATVAPAASIRPPADTSSTDTSAFSMDAFDDDLLGDFDETDFCVTEDGHPDEFIVPETSVPTLPPPPQQNQGSRNTSPVRQVPPQPQQYNYARPTGNTNLPPRPPQTPTPGGARPNGGAGPRPYQPANHQANSRPQAPPQRQNNNHGNAQGSFNGQKPPIANNNNGGGGGGGGGGSIANASVGAGTGAANSMEGTPWLSARAVAKVGDGDALAAVAPSVQAGQLFNPKAESPSIRKTPGVDHNMSKPVPKMERPLGSAPPSASALATADKGRHASPTISTGGGGMPGNAVAAGGSSIPANVGMASGPPAARGPLAPHPLPEPAGIRRIGAPPSAASPLANRCQFRPPPMKRGPPTDSAGGPVGNTNNNNNLTRPPLADVSNNVSANGGTAVAVGGAGTGAPGVDAKRQKIA
ncbi:rad52 DNA repair protein radc [Niveomyces insectorum RCEF 264]|uniref:RAD52 homolog n=1 Tax=Niveomyces insectorum RCEF 264 TaxID=1081102 RepID=A0A162MQW4_9HYPO|nr:rad52 DNA repair protein radc [Niveomyces insectorum RCEF 264]